VNCLFFYFFVDFSAGGDGYRTSGQRYTVFIYRIRYNIKLSLFPSRGSQQRPESVEATTAEAETRRGCSQQRPESAEAGQKKATTQTP
jgi:hypothetical protein